MKIALLGDIALFGKNTFKEGSYKTRFAPIRKYFEDCDYVIGNLETPLTSYNRTVGGKSAYIKGNPKDIEILKYLGISHVSLANNHMYDFRQQGLEETIRILDENGIGWYGINGKQIKVGTPDNEIVFMGYCCYSTNGKGMGIVNVLDPLTIESDLDKAGEALPILSMHWGQEHVHYPNYDHVEVARKLCDGRHLFIHGHHPHVIQGIESIGESLVAYSLGNFCFDDVYTTKSNEPLVKLSKDNKESFIIILDVDNCRIVNNRIIPFSFSEGTYRVEDGINDKIREWSEFLCADIEEYNKIRSNDLSSYISGRKAKRNIQWYMSRLNFESVRMIYGAKKNRKIYEGMVRKYIS